jgi:intracellular sulfur oxidation DsrE/DsrF family protein
MQFAKRLAVAAILGFGLAILPAVSPVHAGANDPLFLNLTTDDNHRIDMALAFGGNQLKRGHPLTVFVNDRAVLAASTANAGKFASQQKALALLVGNGATVLVCPMCMKHYGVSEADLLPGLAVGNPERTGGALFEENSRTLTW